jgi:methyl-accepting chemotaxis protein
MTATIQITTTDTLRTIIDNIPVSVQIIGQDGRYRDCNATTYTLFGAADGDIIGKTPQLFFPPRQSDGSDSAEKAAAYIREAFAGNVVTFEWEHIRRDGTIFPCQVTLKTIEYDGEPCLMGTIADISDQVALLRKSEFIIASSPVPIVEIRPDLSISGANDAFCQLSGDTAEHLKTISITDFKVTNRVGGTLAEGLENRHAVSGDLDALVPSGLKNLNYHYTPFFGADNTLLSIIAYYIDKTQER